VVDGIDAVSLRLDEGTMTFGWGISGCDFFGGDQGRIEKDGNSWTLLPAIGRSSFTWDSGGSFGNEVTELTATIDGELDYLDVRGQIGGSLVIQDWQHGGSCPICGGNLGPTGKEECADPYLGD